MDIRLLGPVEASVDGRPVPSAARSHGRCWRSWRCRRDHRLHRAPDRGPVGRAAAGDRGQARAGSTCRNCARRWPRAATARRSSPAAHGYQLQLAPEDVDAGVRALLRPGSRARRSRSGAVRPSTDVADEPFAAAEIRRLEELRLAALELAIDADLAAGRQLEVVDELDALVAREPLRERLHGAACSRCTAAAARPTRSTAYREARRAGRAGGHRAGRLRRCTSDPARRRSLRADAARRAVASGAAAAEDEVADVRRARPAARRSARSRGWRRSTSTTPTCSSGASGSVAEMVARLAGAPLMASSGRRAVASPRRCVRACWRRWRRACCRAPSAGRSWCCGPGSTRCAHSSRRRRATRRRAVVAASTSSRRCSRPAATRRERAAFVARSSTARATSAAGRSSWSRCAPTSTGAAPRYPELSRLLGANHVLVGPMRRDELRRAIELPARGPGWRRAGAGRRAGGRRRRASRGRCRCCRPRCSSCGSSATGGGCAWTPTSAPAASAARSRGSPSAPTRGSIPAQRAVARRILLRLAGEGDGDVVRRRVPLDELEAAATGVAEVLAVLADERLVTIGEGEVEVAHEALLREWPRLRGWLEEDARAAGCTAT